jgi:hypothetical protein
MNESQHGRAERLILARRVEGLGEGDRAWLDAHLEDCPECAALEAGTARSISALRTSVVELPAGLAERARRRVWLRAGTPGPRPWAIWAACAVSWVFGAAVSPQVWRAVAWAGSEFGLPRPLWRIGFAMWWVIPALLAAGAIALERGQNASQEDGYDDGRI